MSILDKLNEKIETLQGFQEITNANDLANHFKEGLRSKLGERFLKADFDTSEYGNGVLFIRYASCPFTEATNETVLNAPFNFIIAVEGFDTEGNLCDDCGDFRAEMILSKLPDGVKKMRRARHPDINYIKGHVSKYFESQCVSYMNEEGVPGNGVTADGGAVTTDGMTSSGNVAIYKKPLEDKKKKPIRRGKQ
jgi:hypothetical protein